MVANYIFIVTNSMPLISSMKCIMSKHVRISTHGVFTTPIERYETINYPAHNSEKIVVVKHFDFSHAHAWNNNTLLHFH